MSSQSFILHAETAFWIHTNGDTDLEQLLLIKKTWWKNFKYFFMKGGEGRKCVNFTQLCGKPENTVLCWICSWEGAATHLPALHIPTAPPHHSVWVDDMLTVCLWGRKILLSLLPDRIKRVSDLLKVTWEICEIRGIKPRALQSYFISACIPVQYGAEHKRVNSTWTCTISGPQWELF